VNTVHIDADLDALAKFISGKSRSDIGRLRDAKVLEVQALQARIVANRKPLDGDNFTEKRDRRRIGELQKEIAYLSTIFEPELNPPPAAA
jgi:hypothetical protein